MTDKSKFSEEELKLPPEIYPNEGNTPRMIKWPTKLFKDYYKICQKLGNSITKVTIALVRQFVNDNKSLLEEK